MKNFLSISLIAAGMLSVTACTQEQTALNKPPGEYDSKTSYTTTNGTNVENKTTESVGYDSNGHKTATVKTQKTVDPPGLFNKSTSTSSETESR